ncbi:MAG TPA: methylmalonyl-CoA mutase family protein, partial [Bacteroidia bacterium]|nr:methylmalonyl-CoA mutase family protein [Bacteroidia bacterium]
DEALSLPTEHAAKLALRTQQVIAYESGVTDTVDPLAGSYFVETLTTQLEEEAWKYIQRIDAMGGSVNAIEEGYIQKEIADASFAYQKAIENNTKIIVGVNKFTSAEKNNTEILRVDDSIRKVQMEKLKQLKSERDNEKVNAILQQLSTDAGAGVNLMPGIIEAVEHYATLGEIADVFRNVFGEYQQS